jgi:o-succinylbenzoate synthase
MTIRVTRIDLHRVRLPLVHSFETSSHRKSSIEHVLVALTDADGAVGWGEIASPADPYYCGETTDTAWHVARRYLVPAVLGASWEHPDGVDSLLARIRGNFFARAGFNMAAWSLWSGRRGTSLARALGGTRREVTAGVSLGIEPTIDALLEQVQRHVDAGYPRIKLKIAPGWDLEPARAVTRAFPDVAVHVDANGAYPGDDEGMAAVRALDPLGLTMIEQPFAPRNLVDHATLKGSVDTPVCLDESVETIEDLRAAVALDAGSILNIKVSRMGGLTAAVRAHDLATSAGWPVWCGGMHEFGVGRAANVALSSLPGFTLPSDVSASEKYYARDVVTTPITATDGQVDVPETPGLGHDVDPETISHFQERHEAFQTTGTTR